ncbi:hypothetical protein [Hydrogenophaga sp. 5NK40-0174]|uniref:hypothetical protein n=1 Tax=Hydrogenophaga sp. 5NK40-0174 TaxID=3127649 RepID=UPI003108FE78
MAKKLTVELLDNGAPAAGVAVKASGCTELETGPAGSAFFLIDEDQVSVTVNGNEVFSSALDALPSHLKIQKSGDAWQVG